MTSRSLTHLARYARGPRASALAATRLASLAFAIAAWGTPAFAASLLAIDVDGMDRTVAAGDDFYRYANGHWLAMTDIPGDKSQVGAFDQLHDIVIQRNKGILEEAASKPSSKLGMLYASYMDEAAIDAKGTRLWAQAPLEVLKDWLRIRALDHYAPYLSAPFVDAQFAFDGKVLAGVSTIRPRWQRGVSMVTRRMGDALGHAYVDQYFPPSAKAAGERLAASILAAYRTRIEQNTWMDAGTKAKALEKLASLKPMVGYPDTWRDYSGVVLSRGDLTGNVDRLEMLDYDHELAKLGKPADRSEWMLPPVTSGGWANPVARVIVFPAASLQPPLFDPQADPAVNYGAIGVIMGHEFTHQFDNNGRRYDASGRLSDGWTKQDAARFETQADRLVAQYDRYEPLPGLHANGRLTLNENIADLGGLVLSHDAYVQSLGGHPAPVIDGLSGEQRFFLSYAQMSRSKTRDPELRQELLSEEHSIDPLRVDNMRNVDAWYAAFDVRPGQKLYLPPADRVHIW